MLTVFLYAFLLLLGCTLLLFFMRHGIDWIPRKAHRVLMALYGYLTFLFIFMVFVMIVMLNEGSLDAKTFADNILIIIGLGGVSSLLGVFHHSGLLFGKKE